MPLMTDNLQQRILRLVLGRIDTNVMGSFVFTFSTSCFKNTELHHRSHQEESLNVKIWTKQACQIDFVLIAQLQSDTCCVASIFTSSNTVCCVGHYVFSCTCGSLQNRKWITLEWWTWHFIDIIKIIETEHSDLQVNVA